MSKDSLPPSRTAEQFVVRFPDGMRDRIAEAAKSSGRSMNAEIIARLQASFADAIPETEVGSLSQAIKELRADMQTQQQFITKLLKTGATVTTNEEGQLVSVTKVYPPDLFSGGQGAVVQLGFEPGKATPAEAIYDFSGKAEQVIGQEGATVADPAKSVKEALAQARRSLREKKGQEKKH